MVILDSSGGRKLTIDGVNEHCPNSQQVIKGGNTNQSGTYRLDATN